MIHTTNKVKRIVMEPKQVIVINSPNSLVTDIDVRLMVTACNTLMCQVMAHWKPGSSVSVILRADMLAAGVVPSEDAQRFFVVDEHQGISSAIAMYDETGFRSKENPTGWNPSGFVFTRSILNNNGVALCDQANPNRPTVAMALFKSIAESIVNPFRNLWWNDPICGEFIAARICDPVEATPVIITLTYTPAVAPVIEQKESVSADTLVSHYNVQAALEKSDTGKLEDKSASADELVQHFDDGRSKDMPALVDVAPEPIKFKVALCNFILPAWSNPSAPNGSKFDFGGTLEHPFQVGISGCCSKYDSQPGVTPRIVFDRQVPGWRRELAKANYVSFNTFQT